MGANHKSLKPVLGVRSITYDAITHAVYEDLTLSASYCQRNRTLTRCDLTLQGDPSNRVTFSMKRTEYFPNARVPPIRRDKFADIAPESSYRANVFAYKHVIRARGCVDTHIADSEHYKDVKSRAAAALSKCRGGLCLAANDKPDSSNAALSPRAPPATSASMASSSALDSLSSSPESSRVGRILSICSSLARLYPSPRYQQSFLSLPISRRINLAKMYTLRYIEASKLSGPHLGKGAFGTVSAVKASFDQDILTVLALPLDLEPFSAAMKRTSTNSSVLVEEISTLIKLLGTQHTVQLLETRFIGEEAYIFMELLQDITLADFVQASQTTGKPICTAVIMSAAGDVADGLQEMHSAGFVNMDVKLENVGLSTKDASYKVMDQGLAQRIGAKGGGCGTPGFMATEVSSDEMGRGGKSSEGW